jgi:flagella basal body P-ring formation protein FlgA
VRLKLSIAVARRDLWEGRIIAEHDLELREIEVDDTGEAWVKDLSETIGGRLSEGIKKGNPLSSCQVRSKPWVKSGESVRVKSEFMESTGRALGDGHQGDLVEVEFAMTRKKGRARVVSAGIVCLEE